MSHPLRNTVLKNRVLWYDGDSTVNATVINQVLGAGLPISGLYVTELNDDIVSFNKLVDVAQQLTIKKTCGEDNLQWNIPDEYKSLNVISYITDKFISECKQNAWDQLAEEIRLSRIAHELKLYTKYGLLDILRVIIYIINTLDQKQVVWGIGRGSSVSSYVLYLIGAHDVDSVLYDLNIEDFLRE